MERQPSDTLGLDVSTPPGANELGQQLGHSNLYVKNLPANVDEPALWQLFSRCGTIEAARVVRSKAQASKGYGFVKFQHVQQAVDAIRTFNGFALNNHPLEVKFADQDAGPPLSELASLFAQFGTVLECRVLHNGDMTRGAGALVRMSSMHQASAAIEGLNNVQNGTGLPLLVRFADTPEEKARKLAKKAAQPPSKFSSFDILQSLAGGYPLSLDGMQPGLPAGFTSFSAAGIPDANGGGHQTPITAIGHSNDHGAMAGLHQDQPLPSPFIDPSMGLTTPAGQVGSHGSFNSSTSTFPQFGDDLTNALSTSPGMLHFRGLTSPAPMNGFGLSLDSNLSQCLPSQSLSTHGSGVGLNGYIASGPSPQVPSPPCSLYVKNLPADADRLFLYEKFAPHGAIYSVKVLPDEQTGKCKGVGFVNYGDAAGARRAINALNGSKLGDKLLHVSEQTPNRHTC
ncbi:hypothetical protein ABBQ38_007101 [Trebouxia sp. C0009 RCD-2024]